MIPRATYRLQFHKDFTFADAASLSDYFAALGVSHIYASPILAARAGSQHGYDVIDPERINPELGGEDGFRAMAAAFQANGLGIILDIVPNHMAVGQADNRRWLDLLAGGRDSPSAEWFDVDWEAPGLENRIFAPFLDGEPHALWEKGDLALVWDECLGQWAFAYYGHRFPLRTEDQKPQTVTGWAEAESLLARQHFVLADWREADRRINWRRFFDITDLAGIRVENPAVFDAVHAKTLALYGEGLIDGVRVDHVDGLADPTAYCRKLHQRLSALRPNPYLVVEKILASHERLPEAWPVQGTTGYDAMNLISALQHADDQGALEILWRGISGRALSFDEEEILARREILDTKFVAQSDAAVRAFARAGGNATKDDLGNVITALRCYRGYATGKPDTPGPGACLSKALDRAQALRPLFEADSDDPPLCEALRRFHQLSAPVAAKAVEDTAFYRYGRLLSRNDVGFDPRRTFLSPADFHASVLTRAKALPHAMLTTATHDHKRGEDARARLAVLSARPGAWTELIRAAPSSSEVHPTDTYMLYQTLVGAWAGEPDAAFAGRIESWCRKYLREAKLRSCWQNPDTGYEDLFCRFGRSLILGEKQAAFRTRLATFIDAITPLAEVNSLVQTVLRYTLPGVPDLYQGAEFMDFSMVDPDNRRPVDYRARQKALYADRAPENIDDLKQRVIANLLHARRDHPDFWRDAGYQPVPAPAGLMAFRRQYGAQSLYVIARCNGADLPDHQMGIAQSGTDLLSGDRIAAGEVSSLNLFAAWPARAIFTDNVTAATASSGNFQFGPAF
ncbi:MAG TPA: malto-oligosyltrehalose synthase [Rhizomicrobium sp.]|nr:malto-oligosyltrehalose synthase [Rhizomicrobium sp.]